MSLFTALQRRAEGRWASNPFVRAYACWMACEAGGDPRDAYARYAAAPRAFPHSLGRILPDARDTVGPWAVFRMTPAEPSSNDVRSRQWPNAVYKL